MNGINNFDFDINSGLIIVGVLLILYFLKLIMNNQKSLAKKLSKTEENNYDNTLVEVGSDTDVKDVVKKGITKGDARIIGNIDEEVMAVIMASVSVYSKIPLNCLKIKSIKKL